MVAVSTCLFLKRGFEELLGNVPWKALWGLISDFGIFSLLYICLFIISDLKWDYQHLKWVDVTKADKSTSEFQWQSGHGWLLLQIYSSNTCARYLRYGKSQSFNHFSPYCLTPTTFIWQWESFTYLQKVWCYLMFCLSQTVRKSCDLVWTTDQEVYKVNTFPAACTFL